VGDDGEEEVKRERRYLNTIFMSRSRSHSSRLREAEYVVVGCVEVGGSEKAAVDAVGGVCGRVGWKTGVSVAASGFSGSA